ncbi:MAG: MBL fold metallo-hydrolase [Gemmataceae bacterium]
MAARQFTFLGTGTSVGIPMVGCECAVCTSPDPRNHRFRCSVLLRVPHGNILIDTSPELRLQLLRERVGVIHAVLYTHYHADHLFGLDDLRPVARHLGHSVPLFCTGEVEGKIRSTFSYAFGPEAELLSSGFIPKLRFERIATEKFRVLGEEIQPIPLEHAHFNVLGFRIRNVAYCTDVSLIPRSSWPYLEDLDVLILDALRLKPHPAHFGLQQALDAIDQFRPRQAYLTHMSHEIEHVEISAQLPPGVALAYDGLSFAF